MDSIDISSIVGFVVSLWRLWYGTLTFNPAAYQAAASSFVGVILALLTLTIAGISLQMGQSAVLFANRVPSRRFMTSLLMGIAWLGISTVFWVATIWMAGRVLTGTWFPLLEVLVVVCLGVTPLVFGFLIFLPYLGNLLYYLFFAWAFMNVLVGLNGLFALSPWQAVICAGIGWLAIFLLAQSRVVKLEPLERWIWRTSTGITEQKHIDDLAEQFALEFGKTASQPSNNDDHGE